MRFAEAPMPRDQIVLIPTTLGDVIPEDHPLRLFDELLDQLDWSEFNEQFRYEKRGRPPIPPRILAAVWIYACFRRVRSSRGLEYQLRNNVEFMWLAHGHQIDHSTLAEFRKTNKSALEKIHRSLIRFVKDLGLIKLGELYVDGTRIKANASRFRTMTAEKARKLLQIVENEIAEYLEQTEWNDENEGLFDDVFGEEQLPEHLKSLQQRKEQLEAILQQCNEMDETRRKQGVDPAKNPFQVPVADQTSVVTPNKNGGYHPNYTPIVANEGDLGLIVESVMTGGVTEHVHLVPMVGNVETTYGVTVGLVAADSHFCTGTHIAELEEKQGKDFLSPHRNGDVLEENPAIRDDVTQPVANGDLDKLPTDPSRKTYSAEAFIYDEEQDVYHCPQGRELPRSHQETTTQSGGQKVTRTIYQSPDCDGCPLVIPCRGEGEFKSGRRVGRDEHETARAKHRKKMSTPEAKQRYAKRLAVGERPFAIIKTLFGMDRFQTRGIDAVTSEFNLFKIAHNVLRLINHIQTPGQLRALIANNQ
jgi:transposase